MNNKVSNRNFNESSITQRKVVVVVFFCVHRLRKIGENHAKCFYSFLEVPKEIVLRVGSENGLKSFLFSLYINRLDLKASLATLINNRITGGFHTRTCN